LITMGESASQAEFNNTSDLLTGAEKPGFSRNTLYSPRNCKKPGFLLLVRRGLKL